MPALAVAGVRWHIASDDVPLFATFGSAFHAIWILVILLTSQSILNMPNQCHHEGRQYIATVTGLLLCFTLGFMVETLLIWEGCKGTSRHTLVVSAGNHPVCHSVPCVMSIDTAMVPRCLRRRMFALATKRQLLHAAGAPFELSKRKHMSLFLFFRLGILASETLITGMLTANPSGTAAY